MHVTCARESKACKVIHGEDCDGAVEGGWKLYCNRHSRGMAGVEVVKPKSGSADAKSTLAALMNMDVLSSKSKGAVGMSASTQHLKVRIYERREDDLQSSIF